jgi:hypothetical protein
MNNRKIPNIIILVAAIALLVVISPVGAEHTETHMSPVDAKLTQYIRQDHVYEHDAEISAMRWQAMGEFYEKQGLLTRDSFDYDKAADLSAARWQAMGKFYEEQGLLTRDSFDYDKAADLSAARWQAMGEFYKDSELLTRDDFDYEAAADASVLR